MLIESLDARLALGRAVREKASATVATRGQMAEAAAWTAARAPDLPEDERQFRELVAARVSRMFACPGSATLH